MTDQDHPADDGLVERYEQLRRVALCGAWPADGFGHGLGVLTSRGMAAWMRAGRPAQPAPTPAADSTLPPPAAPDALTGAVVAVLAEMALAHT